jgi:hypothetical protein
MQPEVPAGQRKVMYQAPIDIVFENGKNVCENVVEAQMDFKLDDKKCFITVTHIPERYF